MVGNPSLTTVGFSVDVFPICSGAGPDAGPVADAADRLRAEQGAAGGAAAARGGGHRHRPPDAQTAAHPSRGTENRRELLTYAAEG